MKQENIDHTEYPKRLKNLSVDKMQHIIQDCKEALAAMPDGPKAGYYQDEICYCSDELTRRAQAKMPAKHFAEFVRVNVGNVNLTDKEFRELVRDTLESVKIPS